MKTLLAAFLIFGTLTFAQTPTPTDPTKPTVAPAADSGTSTDIFVMFGSDVTRPGHDAKANYNIGVGHTFKFLSKNPFGDEITASYTYENGGAGFLHSNFGAHTETIGLMKNFGIPYLSDIETGKWSTTKKVTMYTWPQIGITSMTGGAVENRLYFGAALGGVIHLSKHNSIWIQENYNKVVTTPWYLTSSIGYTFSY